MLSGPLEQLASRKSARVQQYADMAAVYRQLLYTLDSMQSDPVPFLSGERPLIAGLINVQMRNNVDCRFPIDETTRHNQRDGSVDVLDGDAGVCRLSKNKRLLSST